MTTRASARASKTLFCLLVCTLSASELAADAIIRSQAMLATTIAEFFVEEDRLTIELEIGASDLAAFRNLLPDGPYEKLGNAPRPMAERLIEFFDQDFRIVADAGAPIMGRIEALEPRKRVLRDEITGEPKPEADDDEVVIFARIEYRLKERPASLAIHGVRSRSPATVGFVVNHGGVAVNDFRYLSPLQTLLLDWDDPWYSRFETRSLQRQYFSPMTGFIYIEPYEVRKEIVARPLNLQNWVDLGLEGRETIPVEIQPQLLRTAAEFLREHHPVVIDGRSIEPELARINFLERTLRTSRIVDPPEELDVHSAMLGAIFVYPVEEPLPQHVTLEWDLWSEGLDRIPASSVDQAGPLPTILERDFRVLEWRNFLKNPELPTLAVVRPPPSTLLRVSSMLRWWLLAIVTLLALRAIARRRASAPAGPALATLGAAGIATALCFWVARDAQLTEERTREIVAGLLHNIYRSFDFRDEEQIYDILERSVEGELLAEIYVETRRALELASQGGARAKVKAVEVIELEFTPESGGGFRSSAVWNVEGSVGHWGHIHGRRNRYRAELAIAPRDGEWKLTELEILEEQRL